MTAQQLGTRIHKLLLKVADSKASNISNAFARMLIMELGDLKGAADDAESLSAHNTAQLTQERDDARQRLADYESADLQITELHAKELADHEKEVAELRAALEVAQKENEGLSRDYRYLMKERDDAKAGWSEAFSIAADKQKELARLRSQGAGRWMQDAAFEIARHVEVYGRFKDAQMVEIIRKHAPVEGAGQSSNPADWGKCPKCHQEMSKGALLHVCARLASPPEGQP